jgi:hypothetical protein
MAILSKSPSMAQEKGSSMQQSTNVGGGSRPTKSKVNIETSAPAEPHTLGRAPGGWLK